MFIHILGTIYCGSSWPYNTFWVKAWNPLNNKLRKGISARLLLRVRKKVLIVVLNIFVISLKKWTTFLFLELVCYPHLVLNLIFLLHHLKPANRLNCIIIRANTGFQQVRVEITQNFSILIMFYLSVLMV